MSSVGNNSMYQDLSNQIARWADINDSIQGSNKENCDKRVSDVFKSTLPQILSKQCAETLEHIDELAREPTLYDSESRAHVITQLDTLKKTLVDVENSLIARNQQTELKEESLYLSLLVDKIDTAIFAVGSLFQPEEKKTVLGQIKELISSIGKAPQSKVSAFIKSRFEDPEFDDKLEHKIESGLWDKFDVVKKKEFSNPSIIPGELIQIELQKKSQNTTEKGMAKQLALDLHRLAGFKINGVTAYTNLRNTGKTPQDAYNALCEACREKVGPEKGDRLAFLIGCIVNQGVFTDMTGKVLIINNEKLENSRIITIGSGQIWSIDIKDDKVVITLKISFSLRNSAPNEKEKVECGAMIAKRVYEIPLKNLLAKDLETKPLSGVKVTDSYSKHIPSAEFAEAILDHF